MRREFLKGYALALVSEGALKGAKSPTEAAKRVIAAVTYDIPIVVTEILSVVAINGLEELKRRASAVHVGIGEKIGEVVERVKSAGFGEFWKDMQKDYWHGVDVNSQKRGG